MHILRGGVSHRDDESNGHFLDVVDAVGLRRSDTWAPTVRLWRRYRTANALLRQLAWQLAAVDFGRTGPASLDAA